MSVIIETKHETVKKSFWVFKWTETETKKTIVYEGKVVKIKQRWEDGGFEWVKRGCYLILEKDNKYQDVECALLPKTDAEDLLDNKTIKITQYLDHSKRWEFNYRYTDGLMKISIEDIEVSKDYDANLEGAKK